MKTLVIMFGTVVGSLLFLAMIFTAGWDRPMLDAKQQGFRGVGMEAVTNPRTEAKLRTANQLPEALEPATPGGPPRVEHLQERTPSWTSQ